MKNAPSVKALLKEIRRLRQCSPGHSFKRRHAPRHRSCRKFGVGQHS